MVAPSSKFYGKMWVGFCLNTGKRLSKRFHFNANKKSIGSSKTSPQFERSACFYVTINENFKRFQYFNFETDFLPFSKNWNTVF